MTKDTMLPGWTVHLEAAAPPDTDSYMLLEEDGDERLSELLELLAEHGGAVAGGRDRYSATLSVEGPQTPQRAIEDCTELFASGAAKASLPAWPLVRVEAMTYAEQDAELAKSTLPELAGVAEAAEMLGVSKQRVSELHRTSRVFPQPIYRLASGPVWMAAAIRAFNERWDRRAGRPPLSVAAEQEPTRDRRAR